jgi:hypothetical protein
MTKHLFYSILFVILVSSMVVIVVQAQTDTVTATVTVSSVSVSLDNSSFAHGTMSSNTASSTLGLWAGAGITATNDGNVAEDFDINGADSTGGTGWTLAGTTASDQYIHKYCNDTDDDCLSPPTNYTVLTTSPAAVWTSVSTSGTRVFQLELTTANPDTTVVQQSAVVTITASAS